MQQQDQPTSFSLFYSYAHEDEALQRQLEIHLSPLRRLRCISDWNMREIVAGEDWKEKIDEHLETASIILLLISPAFLASDYCYDVEMQRALERHQAGEARVIPIFLRPVYWQDAPFANLQGLPTAHKPVTSWENPDEAFSHIAGELRKMILAKRGLPHPQKATNRMSRARLLQRVQGHWIDGLLKRSEQQTPWIHLHLQEEPEMLDNPWLAQVQELRRTPELLPVTISIAQIYDEADGQLLILGQAGSGKTMLLLQLARTLAERVRHNKNEPVPVILNLSSWGKQRQETLENWIIREINRKYGIRGNPVRKWLQTNQIIPLLDGLDEVVGRDGAKCVQAIIAYTQQDNAPLVICCSSEKYHRLSQKLSLQRAVSIQPLNEAQIETYLTETSNQVAGLQEVLQQDKELAQWAEKPLMLNVLTLAYQGAHADEIPSGFSRNKLRHLIFARYVERMLYYRHGELTRWQPQQAINWLTFLARQMQRLQQSDFAIEELQADWLSEDGNKWYERLIKMVIGGAYGAVSVPGAWLANQGLGWHLGPLFLVSFGLLNGIIWGIRGRIEKIVPAEKLVWSWEIIAALLIGGLTFGISWFITGSTHQVLLSVMAAMATILLFQLLGGSLSSKRILKRATLRPNEGIWRSALNGLIVALIIGPFAGILFWAQFGLTIGLLCIVFGGLFSGLFLGLEAFMKHFLLRIALVRQGNFPWKLVPFLNESVERLFLFRVGGNYVFLHRFLLEYFANPGESALEDKTVPRYRARAPKRKAAARRKKK